MISWKIVWSSPAHFCKAWLVSPAAAWHLPDCSLSGLVLSLLGGADEVIRLGNLKPPPATVSLQHSRECWSAPDVQEVLAKFNFAAEEQEQSQGRVLERQASHLCHGRGLGGSVWVWGRWQKPSGLQFCHQRPQAGPWLLHQQPQASGTDKGGCRSWTLSGFTSSLLP